MDKLPPELPIYVGMEEVMIQIRADLEENTNRLLRPLWMIVIVLVIILFNLN